VNIFVHSLTHFHAKTKHYFINYMSRMEEICGELGSEISAHARIDAHPLAPKNRVLWLRRCALFRGTFYFLILCSPYKIWVVVWYLFPYRHHRLFSNGRFQCRPSNRHPSKRVCMWRPCSFGFPFLCFFSFGVEWLFDILWLITPPPVHCARAPAQNGPKSPIIGRPLEGGGVHFTNEKGHKIFLGQIFP